MTSQPQDLVNTVLKAYRQGVFPMADPDDPDLTWYCPDPRAIIPLTQSQGLHLSRSLRRRIRAGHFLITTDRAFGQVIHNCAEPRPVREETWIDPTITNIFELLHEAGHAHSIEVWTQSQNGPDDRSKDQLVGGLYGLAIGSAFCAESMFSHPDRGGTDASKIAIAHLAHHLHRQDFTLLDVQFWNEHIDQFGCIEIPRDEYLQRLAEALEQDPPWTPFEPERIADEL